ncbi:MAG TPA: flavodoxin domain-containing protein [Microbacterium sp.]|nr:flavodoxin domain-containing protein [Microbacterium sp.]
MKVNIIFGTESGESELKAEEISEALGDEFDTTIENMADVDTTALDTDAFCIVVCSTYGEGDLPHSAIPFHEALTAQRPDLSGLKYAVFGRGDRSYANTYSRGSEHIDELLRELGADRVGEYGRDDAGDWNAPADLAAQWTRSIVPFIRN